MERCSNSSEIQPAEIDKTSSMKYVYVRSNFVFIEASEDGNIPAHWEYDEEKVLKENWELYRTLSDENKKLKADLTYLAMMTEVEL